jgi:glycosyltransferase involved in cell wall biosynthesis
MKVLALSSYPMEAAATRFRIGQYIEPLREKGIYIDLRPFLDQRSFSSFYSSGNRIGKALSLLPSLTQRFSLLSPSRYDAVFVQREAMLIGPPLFEWYFSSIKEIPMILDLDDATYVPYESPSFGRLGSLLKSFGKADWLIDHAKTVVCGNNYIADYVTSRGGNAVILPTTVDGSIFKPITKSERVPVIGWIGTHSTYPLLEKVFPVLERLAKTNQFILRVIGSGCQEISIPGVRVEIIDWNQAREPFDFADLDIGLYPLSVVSNAPAEWLAGKSGFKAIQYLAVGIPFVMTPIGVCTTIGRHGVTHFNADSAEEWFAHLQCLLSSFEMRKTMGSSGRELFKSEYSLSSNIDVLATAITDLMNKKGD